MSTIRTPKTRIEVAMPLAAALLIIFAHMVNDSVVAGEVVESSHRYPMPSTQEPDFAEAGKNLDLGVSLQYAESPAAHFLVSGHQFGSAPCV